MAGLGKIRGREILNRPTHGHWSVEIKKNQNPKKQFDTTYMLYLLNSEHNP